MFRSSAGRGGAIGGCRRDVTVDEGDPASTPFRSRRIAPGFAVRLRRHRFDLVLARFHPGQGLREALVLDDRRVRDPLFLVEDAIRQSDAFPTHFEPTVGKLVGLDVFAGQTSRQRRLVQNNPLAVVGQGELLSDIALLSPSQNRIELRGVTF
jgi:hypothetical protein